MVIYMKYVFFEMIFCLLVISLILVTDEKQSAESVFNEIDETNSYEFVTIDTPGLTTKNFYKYFKDTKFVRIIYPKINNIYKNKIEEITYSCDNCDINDLKHFYKNYLYNKGYKNDSFLIDYYGVEIDKIGLYINQEKLKQILKKCLLCRL